MIIYRHSRSPHNVEGQRADNVVVPRRIVWERDYIVCCSPLSPRSFLSSGGVETALCSAAGSCSEVVLSFKQRLPLLVAAAADVGRRSSSTKNTSTLRKLVVPKRTVTFAHSLSPSRHFHLLSTAMATDTSKPPDPDPEQKPHNKLAAEKSPYLQQHASNPVLW